MKAEVAQFLNRGMRKDLSIDKTSNEFAFENRNIRITEDATHSLLSVTNDKGNYPLNIYAYNNPSEIFTIQGNIIGRCVINNNLVLFTTIPRNYTNGDIIGSFDGEEGTTLLPDRIIRIHWNGSKFIGKTLYEGSLNFSMLNPIETLGDYESENIIKVYWVDGINQVRFINIVADDDTQASWDSTSFDFSPEVGLVGNLRISRNYQTEGSFPSGTIQYFLTYSRINGQETSIFQSSLVYPVVFKDRAGSPTENISCSFDITIDAANTSFDYINIYAVHRASLNGSINARAVASIKIPENKEYTYTDTGLVGASIDPSELLYKGGDIIIGSTLDSKDNTLFVGNIKIKRDKVSAQTNTEVLNMVSVDTDMVPGNVVDNGEYFPYVQDENPEHKYLKANEYYRVGVQLLDKYGKWSSPICVEPLYHHSYKPSTRQVSDKEYWSLPNSYIYVDPAYIQSFMAEHPEYIGLRAVMVYPNEQERSCFAQGVVNPTVFSLTDRYNNRPFACSSWFFRPKKGQEGTDAIEYRHAHLIPEAGLPNSEIKSQDNISYVAQDTPHSSLALWIKRNYALCNPKLSLTSGSKSLAAGTVWYSKNADNETIEHTFTNGYQAEYFGYNDTSHYAIDANIVTLNSPDIENKQEISNNLKFRIVGEIPIDRSYGISNINLSSGPHSASGAGEYKRTVKGGSALLTRALFIDSPTSSFEDAGETKYPLYGYPVYPWHSEGSLTSDANYNTLENKYLSNLRYSNKSVFYNTVWETNNTQVALYDPDKGNLISLNGYSNDTLLNDSIVKNSLNYYGSVDTIVSPRYISTPNYVAGAYASKSMRAAAFYNALINDGMWYFKPFEHWGLVGAGYAVGPSGYIFENFNSYDPDTITIEAQPGTRLNVDFPATERFDYSMSPVNISYRSTKHAVFCLDTLSNGKMPVLPGYNPIDYNSGWYGLSKSNMEERQYGYPFWMKQTDGSYELSDYISDSGYTGSSNKAILYLGELYKEVDTDTIFGGTSEEALENNIWLPASKTVLFKDIRTTGTRLTIIGDTKYQRWDCLKTYAYKEGETNTVVDILSFMVESFTDLDSRYDRNRGKQDNSYMSPDNFNLFNDAYEQKDNYFTYRILPDRYYNSLSYPNQFVWSQPKFAGSDIDNWTNISLSSFYSADGIYGPINKIKKQGNALIGFQDKGIFEILFNSRSQIATTTGVPIELANSGKVDGIRYISTTTGCKNKWSIVETQTGLYFIDDDNYTINKIASQGVQNISSQRGFDKYLRDHLKTGNYLSYWTPAYWDRWISYYDPILNDIYFVSNTETLVFSEKLDEFMTFFDYGRVLPIESIEDALISFKDNPVESSSIPYVRRSSAPNYGVFYGEPKGYSVTYRVSKDPYIDKTFTNLEYNAEMKDSNNVNYNESFTKLSIDTDDQHGESTLVVGKNLIKKFRIWRANIPRQYNAPLNRIKGPWATITLKVPAEDNDSTKQIELHNLIVKYFV